MSPSTKTERATNCAEHAVAARPIRFLLDGQLHEVPLAVAPTRTVLNYLREDLGRCGSKEGCAEGDCGACTVVLAEPADDDERAAGVAPLRYRAINACIQFLPAIDGKALITIENLQLQGGDPHPAPHPVPHPVQQAMIDAHGSQCGFCTPGFVMSLFALYKTQPNPDREAINQALSGNLCRCTGYRPIIEAGLDMARLGAQLPESALDWLSAPASCAAATADASTQAVRARLQALQQAAPLHLSHSEGDFHAPQSLPALLALRAALPQARLLAGSTDVGLWVTKQHRDLGSLIYLGRVPELQRIAQSDGWLEIGAAVSLSDAMPVLLQHYPSLQALLERFASTPIRNAATLGGNIANGSPIGDSMPALIAIGASVVLRSQSASRELPLEAFYLDYQKTALQADEVLACVRIPLPGTDGGLQQHVASYKVSRRFEQDISAVCAGFSLWLEQGRVQSARIAFGGMAATPRRAAGCEAALQGLRWHRDTSLDAACAALAADYTPLTDLRATAHYRQLVAGNLLRRFLLETTAAGAATSAETEAADGVQPVLSLYRWNAVSA